jgi:hypothetical protein
MTSGHVKCRPVWQWFSKLNLDFRALSFVQPRAVSLLFRRRRMARRCGRSKKPGMRLRSSPESAPAPASPRFEEYSIHARMRLNQFGSVTESEHRNLALQSVQSPKPGCGGLVSFPCKENDTDTPDILDSFSPQPSANEKGCLCGVAQSRTAERTYNYVFPRDNLSPRLSPRMTNGSSFTIVRKSRF